MFAVPDIGYKKATQQTSQPHGRHGSVPNAQRSARRTSGAELKKPTQTVIARCDMVYTPIGQRDIRGTFRVKLQKDIVNTIRGLNSTRLPTGIGLDLSEKPFFSVQFIFNHDPLAHQSQAHQQTGTKVPGVPCDRPVELLHDWLPECPLSAARYDPPDANR